MVAEFYVQFSLSDESLHKVVKWFVSWESFSWVERHLSLQNLK